MQGMENWLLENEDQGNNYNWVTTKGWKPSFLADDHKDGQEQLISCPRLALYSS